MAGQDFFVLFWLSATCTSSAPAYLGFLTETASSELLLRLPGSGSLPVRACVFRCNAKSLKPRVGSPGGRAESKHVAVSAGRVRAHVFHYQARHDSLDPQPDALQVKGKVNAITIDQCVRTGVVFEDLVAVCELVNSSSLQVQVTGRVPTIAIDKCDGVQVRCQVQRREMLRWLSPCEACDDEVLIA